MFLVTHPENYRDITDVVFLPHKHVSGYRSWELQRYHRWCVFATQTCFWLHILRITEISQMVCFCHTNMFLVTHPENHRDITDVMFCHTNMFLVSHPENYRDITDVMFLPHQHNSGYTSWELQRYHRCCFLSLYTLLLEYTIKML